jgi:hypothetical protein
VEAAAGWALEAGGDSQRSGLATAGRAKQYQETAVRDVEVEVDECDDLLEFLAGLVEAHVHAGRSYALSSARRATAVSTAWMSCPNRSSSST